MGGRVKMSERGGQKVMTVLISAIKKEELEIKSYDCFVHKKNHR